MITLADVELDRAALVVGIVSAVVGVHDSIFWMQIIGGTGLGYYLSKSADSDSTPGDIE